MTQVPDFAILQFSGGGTRELQYCKVRYLCAGGVAQRALVRDGDAAAAQADPAFRAPRLQVLVHDLPRQSEELRELFLRQRETRAAAFGGAAMQRSEAQQALGEPCR